MINHLSEIISVNRIVEEAFSLVRLNQEDHDAWMKAQSDIFNIYIAPDYREGRKPSTINLNTFLRHFQVLTKIHSPRCQRPHELPHLYELQE